ncbi:rust resistance kinase Lr10-like [Ananas comosus]|uniref:Rust resistance kinase Lr10-like n=1 Tax=Ananas comosus TaxID=4615 RepID=A0A6P5FKN2_ANACO|nr:rust resistance kinase Lr10-like [Ananas comosus]
MVKKKASAHPLFMSTIQISASQALLITCLLLFDVSRLASARCRPFSCGALQDIGYPFRSKGDPDKCGDRRFQLACVDGNKTVWDIHQAGTYYVTEISKINRNFFGYRYNNFTVVDANLANGSNCSLPSQSLSRTSIESMGFNIYEFTWATFVSCTRMIVNSTYNPVPCLSKTGAFVYVIFSWRALHLDYAERLCSFLAMTPITLDPERMQVMNGNIYSLEHPTTEYVFQLLKRGFPVPLETYLPKSVGDCLKDSAKVAWPYMYGGGILSPRFFFAYSGVTLIGCMEDTHNRLSQWVSVLLLALDSAGQILTTLLFLCRFIIAPLAIFLFLAHKLWREKKSVDAVEKFLRSQRALAPTRYAYTDLIAITGHFREKLGQGGYGSVFKGVFPGGVLVAVKMLLTNSKCNGEEFINEVSTIGRIHHVNVIKLVGFCSEGTKRALVYEYMPNGSLDKHIFSTNGIAGRRTFKWDKLHDIALGIAHGINYLHQGCDKRILHFDIKPQNILLDRNFTPKVSDFGLAKLYPKDTSLVSMSTTRGTTGYIAPELISRSFGIISHKSDVYSFGMLLMEMAGGRRNADPRAENSSQAYYPSWIYDRLTQPEISEITTTFDISEGERKLCIVGLWCIQIRPLARPAMSKVIEMLEADVGTLEMPPKPFFSSEEPIPTISVSCLGSSLELPSISEDE